MCSHNYFVAEWVVHKTSKRTGKVLGHFHGPHLTAVFCQAKCMYEPAYSACVSVNYEVHASGDSCTLLSSFGQLVSSTTSTVLDYTKAVPSNPPSGSPSGPPSGQPSGQPTGQPSGQPSSHPTGLPTYDAAAPYAMGDNFYMDLEGNIE